MRVGAFLLKRFNGAHGPSRASIRLRFLSRPYFLDDNELHGIPRVVDSDKKKHQTHRSDHEKRGGGVGNERECSNEKQSVCDEGKNDVEDPVLENGLVFSNSARANENERRICNSADTENAEEYCGAG